MVFWLFACSSSNDGVSDGEMDPPSGNIGPHPNIVLIIADDMGLDATPGYSLGNSKPNMPNIENMISTGIVFNNVWSNPTCTPTRAGMLTGKYGFRTNVLSVGDQLATSEISLQAYLDDTASADYSNAVIGKWHLSADQTHPNSMGIDYFAGFLSGTLPSYTNWDLTINGTSSTSSDYATSKFTDLAIDWVQDQSQPWFLWLAYNAPHSPLHVPPSNLHSQGNLPSDQASIDANPLPYYMAMLEAMDTEIGRFLDALSPEERENSVFIFVGDNGTPRNVIQAYRGFKAKGTVYQGGIHVPMVVSGKNVTRMNAVENALINTTDIFATIAEIAGSNTAEIHDSKSFKDLLTQGGESKREYAYGEIGNDLGSSDYTIRNQTHKYIHFADGSEELYHLEQDPLENVNLLDLEELPLNAMDTQELEDLRAALTTVWEQ